MSFESLKGYKPEKPSDGGFEPFKYSGPAIIEKSVISINENIDSEFYPKGCNVIDITATIMDGEYAGRKLFKRFNLDSEVEDKKGKTPLLKLADQLFAVGITFGSLDELKTKNENFVGMNINVKAYPIDFKDGTDPRQAWNIKGIQTSMVGVKPSF